MDANRNPQRSDLALVLAGEAGQGVQAVESLLTEAFRQEGYHVFAEEGRPTFNESVGIFQDDATPLFRRTVDTDRLRTLIEEYRTKGDVPNF